MQKSARYPVWISLLLAILLIVPLSACSGGGTQTAEIVFDFSNGSPEEDIRVETYSARGEITDEAKIKELSRLSGLDFNVTLHKDGDRLIADWSADSTLIAGLDQRTQKEDFYFHDVDSLRWFMLDSLWQTLEKRDIYYTMDGGQELALAELYPVEVFPAHLPYMGSAFYFAHADVVGDFFYADKEYGLLLNYPHTFAQQPEETDGTMLRFPSTQDNTALQYWVIPNTYQDTPESFADGAPAEEIKLDGDVVTGFGLDLDQVSGVETPTAYYWLVRQDWIACVAIACETAQEAQKWAEQMAQGAVSIVGLEAGIGQEEAMDLLTKTLEMTEGAAVVARGQDMVGDELCWTFAYGKNTAEKFTAEEHYAVTGDGTLLKLDISSNTYQRFSARN